MLRSGSVHFICPANMRPSVVCRWRVRLRKVDRYEEAVAEAFEADVVGGSMVACSVLALVWLYSYVEIEVEQGGREASSTLRCGDFWCSESHSSTTTLHRHLYDTVPHL